MKVSQILKSIDDSSNSLAMDQFERQALDMFLSSKAQTAFDLSLESAKVRERYGMNSWGQQCLMARRLVESGVDIVTTEFDGPLCGRVANWDDHAVNHHVFDALKAGSDGYLLKNTPLKSIKKGIQQIVEEGAPISPVIAKKVINYFNPQKQHKIDGFEDLSSREIEVLQALSDGLPFKNIADKLFITIDTVRYHTKNIYKKLHVNSKLGAVKKYLSR